MSTTKIAYLVSLSVFSKELFGVALLGSVVDVYQVGVAAIGLVMMVMGSEKALNMLAAWGALLALSAALLFYYGHAFDVLVKQGVVAAFVYAGFAALIERTTPGDLLKAYLNVCYGAAVFGLLQFSLSLGGVELLMKVPGRLDSLTYEPSHYAIAIAPAAYLAMRTLWKTRDFRKVRELTILASMLCTVSLTALMVLVVSGVVIGARDRGALLVAIVIAVVFTGYTNQDLLPEEIQKRIEAIEGGVGEDTAVSEIQNLSMFSIKSNWEVAVDTLKQGRLLGNGFGGHEGAYVDYHGDYVSVMGDRFGVNLIAGHSLFIRVFSEFGLLGMFIYGLWFLKGVRWAKEPLRLWWTLSAIYLVGRVFKLGGYFEVGMPIFIVAPIVFYGWRDVIPVRRRKPRRKRTRRQSKLAEALEPKEPDERLAIPEPNRGN